MMAPRPARESAVRGAGLVLGLAGAVGVAWLFVQQPASLEELSGGVAAAVGVYRVDPVDFAEGRELFAAERYPEARAALTRADPASRDATTLFYIAYSFYREGWGRLYNDDALFQAGLAAVNRAIAVAPDGRVRVDDPALDIKTADELKAELEQGLRRELSDLNPFKVFRRRR